MSAPVLAHFDPHRSAEIHADASAVGVGAVLVQKYDDGEHSVAYISKALNKAQKIFSATELELFAVVVAVEKFYYTGNQPFEIVTDHSAIAASLKTKKPANRLTRWIRSLAPYNFEVVYRPGKQNCFNDALPRFMENS